jgi:hypothetical protein
MKQINGNEIDRACSTNGVRRMHIGYWWESHETIKKAKTYVGYYDNIKMDLRETE